MRRDRGGECPRPASRAHRTVLLIDPDGSSRDLYGTLLRHLGLRVLEASNGAEGVLLARECRPDVIVTELFARAGESWRVPSLLRDDPRTADIPLLAVSTKASKEAEARALAGGCEGYLRKPCEPSAVAREVARLLDGGDR